VNRLTHSDLLADGTPSDQSVFVDAILKLLRGVTYVQRLPCETIAVDDTVLDSYVGTYGLGPVTFSVSRIVRALALQPDEQSAINELLTGTPTRNMVRRPRSLHGRVIFQLTRTVPVTPFAGSVSGAG